MQYAEAVVCMYTGSAWNSKAAHSKAPYADPSELEAMPDNWCFVMRVMRRRIGDPIFPALWWGLEATNEQMEDGTAEMRLDDLILYANAHPETGTPVEEGGTLPRDYQSAGR